jgi:hypothetical protein
MSVLGGLPEGPVNVNPVIRDSDSWFGSRVNPTDDVIVTLPLACTVMPFVVGISTAEDHDTVHEPGTITVSPVCAELMAD